MYGWTCLVYFKQETYLNQIMTEQPHKSLKKKCTTNSRPIATQRKADRTAEQSEEHTHTPSHTDEGKS